MIHPNSAQQPPLTMRQRTAPLLAPRFATQPLLPEHIGNSRSEAHNVLAVLAFVVMAIVRVAVFIAPGIAVSAGEVRTSVVLALVSFVGDVCFALGRVG